ncbi:MAG: peptidase domain-containing ABC transporter [Flavobacterium sp.]
MNKFPNYRQLDGKDCGPACIQIIAKHYGKFISLQEIRELSSISKEGLSLYELGLTAERLGLKSLPVKATLSNLENEIPLPCIVHWGNRHYIVIYKIDKKYCYVSDPLLGLIKYSKEEFLKKWVGVNIEKTEKGVLLLLETTDKFNQIKPSVNPSKIYAFNYFLSHLKPYKKQTIQLLLTMFVLTLVQAMLPFITQSIVDTGITSKDYNFILLLLIANVVLVISVSLGNWIRQSINIHISSRIKISILSNYIIKLLKLPLGYFENKLVGDIFQRALDYDRMENFIMNSAFSIILAFFNLLVFGVILCIYEPLLLLVFLVGAIAYISWTMFFWNVRKKLDFEFFTLKAKSNSHWIELLTHIEEIKNNNYEQGKRWSWEKIQVKLYHINLKTLKVNQIDGVGGNLISTLSDIALTFLTVYFVIEGQITLGMMIAVQYILGQLKSPLSAIIQFISSYQAAYISFVRINESSNTPDEQSEDNVYHRSLPENKSLILKNVYFGYNNSPKHILSNINIQIEQGKTTAIVGASGSGKSTLLKILARLYKPTSGDFFIGNTNMSSVDLGIWRDKLGVVNQNSDVFKETIKDNIILGNEYDIDKFYDVVRKVNLQEEIESLPAGFNTLMGENGRGLSEGQKQRIMIARALYKNPDYLFLDEATNSLDSINESILVKNLEGIFTGKTVIIVAHRLATIKNADNIIVLDKGSVVEMGNENNLMSRKGFYYRLIQNQMILETNE